jgi:opacity protein-like surface antigen
MRRPFGLASILLLAAAASASAGDVGIGLGSGYVNPSDVGGTAWFTGSLRIKVGNSVAIEPEVGYWKKSESVPGLVDVSIKDLNVGANVLYLAAAGENVTVSVGGGIGAHFLKGAVGVLGFQESDSETKLGGQILAGVDFKVAQNVALFASVRCDLVSDFNQFKAYGGIRLGL